MLYVDPEAVVRRKHAVLKRRDYVLVVRLSFNAMLKHSTELYIFINFFMVTYCMVTFDTYLGEQLDMAH